MHKKERQKRKTKNKKKIKKETFCNLLKKKSISVINSNSTTAPYTG